MPLRSLKVASGRFSVRVPGNSIDWEVYLSGVKLRLETTLLAAARNLGLSDIESMSVVLKTDASRQLQEIESASTIIISYEAFAEARWESPSQDPESVTSLVTMFESEEHAAFKAMLMDAIIGASHAYEIPI